MSEDTATATEDTPVTEAPAETAAPVEETPAPAGRENLYEGMFLLDSGKFAQDPDGLSGKVLEIIEKAGGTVVAHRPWSDGKLAYPIEGHRKGLHYLVYYRMPTAGATTLTRACKLSDVVMRHMTIRQPPVLFEAMVHALTGGEEQPAAG